MEKSNRRLKNSSKFDRTGYKRKSMLVRSSMRRIANSSPKDRPMLVYKSSTKGY